LIETVSVARGMRRPDEPPIDNDQELVAVGLASVAGAYFRVMPAAGGFSQTAVNERAGARTQMSELTTAGLAVLVALFLAPVLSDLPEATLGAMVVVATLGLVKPAEFVMLFRFSRLEFFLALGTAAIALVSGSSSESRPASRSRSSWSCTSSTIPTSSRSARGRPVGSFLPHRPWTRCRACSGSVHRSTPPTPAPPSVACSSTSTALIRARPCSFSTPHRSGWSA
jgi:hypothetical protein